jgi:hypothetical protein
MSASADRGARVVVLAPHAERIQRAETRPVAPRLASLEGARIGFVDNGFSAVAILHDEFRRGLAAYGIAPVIERKRYWRPLDPDRLDALAGAADAVIGGLCNTPPSTAWGTYDAVELEKRGRPTITLATAYYEDLLAESVLNEGMPELRRVVLPYPLEGRSEALIREVARTAMPYVVAALTEATSPVVDRVALPPER